MFDTRLREISRGVLEGQLGAAMVGEQRELYLAMRRRVFEVGPPGGETYHDLMARTVPWLEGLPASGKVAAVTHGGVIYTLLRHVVGVERTIKW